MAGLIQTELDDELVKPADMLDAGKVAQAGSVGYEADTRTIDAGKETVAGQMEGLLNAESPYITRARTKAAQTANSRGLLNSSIAAGAGEAAAIDAALPIASQDANAYGTASRDNQAARNQASQFGASEANTSARLGADALNQAGRMALGAELEKSLIGTREGAESRLSGQQSAQQQALAKVQGEIEKGLVTTREQAEARLKELAGQIETGLVGTRAAAESTLQAEKAVQEKELTQLRGQLEQQLQTLRGGQAEMLAGIESQYRSLIQASASATSFYTDIVKSISAVMANVDTSAEQKQAAVDTMGAMLRSGLNVIGGIANMDIAGLLDFTA